MHEHRCGSGHNYQVKYYVRAPREILWSSESSNKIWRIKLAALLYGQQNSSSNTVSDSQRKKLPLYQIVLCVLGIPPAKVFGIIEFDLVHKSCFAINRRMHAPYIALAVKPNYGREVVNKSKIRISGGSERSLSRDGKLRHFIKARVVVWPCRESRESWTPSDARNHSFFSLLPCQPLI